MTMTALRMILLSSLLSLATSFQAAFSQQQVEQHLAAGEFAAAIDQTTRLPAAARDPILAQIASAQSLSGDSVAAGNTMQSGQSSSDLVDSVGRAAAGGGSFADFQSLMDLIQTTVVPDTWEALGGPSTMSPYPQGVYVDATGTLRDCESFAATDGIRELKSLLSSDRAEPGDESLRWRQPSSLRCISLRRLMHQATQWQFSGLAPSDEMMHLAGVSQVQYVFLENDDIVIAGPVGGIEQDQGWYRDRRSGLHPMRLDFLRNNLRSALENQPFGCTIDPTREGLQRAAALGVAIQQNRIPIGKAADEMIKALGMQRVEVFGTAGDTPVGYIMIEADRHMKQLALGVHPMPRGALNYLDVIDRTIERGPPSELLLRLWFTAAPRAVRADADRTVFELAGTPIRLSGENERAMASGQRGNITEDFRTEAFVADFNKNWNDIRSAYPIYAALESLYQTASVAELIRRYAKAAEHQQLAAGLAGSQVESDYVLPTPRQVESIATMHTVRHGSKRHHVLLVSGGVSVDSRQTLVSEILDYPSLGSVATRSKSRPIVIQRWWWDAER